MNGVVDPSEPLSREVGLESNDEGDKYDNDCVILKRSSDQRNTLVLHDSESSESVSKSSDSSKGYVENSVTVTVNSLSKFYIDLIVHTLYPVCF